MPGIAIVTRYDQSLEEHAMRRAGMLGTGQNANQLFSIDYDSLPPEAIETIKLIIKGGPFQSSQDGSSFNNRFGDLPSGKYIEFTVRTPGARNRGLRRIVARKKTAQLFFTACHYERIGVSGGSATQRAAAQQASTLALDADLRNGFYIVTGMPIETRNAIQDAIKRDYP